MTAKLSPVKGANMENGEKNIATKSKTIKVKNTISDVNSNKINGSQGKLFCLICGRLQRRKCVSFFYMDNQNKILNRSENF